MQRNTLPGLLTVVVLLSACSPTLERKCPLPEGVGCMSQSEVYRRLDEGSLPTLHPRPSTGSEGSSADEGFAGREGASSAKPAEGKVVATVEAGTPLFVPPEPIRIWFAPWRNEQGDLHSESYVYTHTGTTDWNTGE